MRLLQFIGNIGASGPGSIRVINVDGGGSNSMVSPALFVVLPILLIAGVAAGFLATNYCKLCFTLHQAL